MTRMGNGAKVTLLVDAARARGIDCRPAFGLLLLLPFSVAHAWPELLVDGKWVAADPVLLRAFVRWGLAAAPVASNGSRPYVPLI